MEKIREGLGDLRLDTRLSDILGKVYGNASASFPAMFPKYCELEGFYRFVNNPRVKLEALMGNFFDGTREQTAANKDVIVIHDTTDICPSSKARSIEEHVAIPP